MIELLVTMTISIVILIAAVLFFEVVFNQQNQINSRLFATEQAEQGLQQMTRDLRDAVPVSALSSGISTTPVSVSTSGSTVTMTMYEPGATSQAAVSEVQWTCTSAGATGASGGGTIVTSPGTCARVVTPCSTTTCSGTGAAATTNTIYGVDTMSATPATASNPAYVAIALTVYDTAVYQDPGTEARSKQAIAAGATAQTIPLNTGVALRNF
jgi:type II secretory pathway pseudopilin PulG